MTEIKRVAPRVQGHIDELRKAGLDTQAFFDALVGIRDDSTLPTAQRDALYRLIASECFIWYLEALRGEPIDRIKLVEDAQRVAEEEGAAIKRKTPGGAAAALLGRTAAAGPKLPEGARVPEAAPADAKTVSERVPDRVRRLMEEKKGPPPKK